MAFVARDRDGNITAVYTRPHQGAQERVTQAEVDAFSQRIEAERPMPPALPDEGDLTTLEGVVQEVRRLREWLGRRLPS